MSFYESLLISYKNGNTKKWYIIESETKGSYSHHNQIKFLTDSLESSLCDYSDVYILVTGNIAVTGGNPNTKVAFKSCLPFKDCRTEINNTFVDYSHFINVTMPIYDLIEYSQNYSSDSSGSVWQFRRDEIAINANVCNENSSLIKKSQILLII